MDTYQKFNKISSQRHLKVDLLYGLRFQPSQTEKIVNSISWDNLDFENEIKNLHSGECECNDYKQHITEEVRNELLIVNSDAQWGIAKIVYSNIWKEMAKAEMDYFLIKSMTKNHINEIIDILRICLLDIEKLKTLLNTSFSGLLQLSVLKWNINDLIYKYQSRSPRGF